MDQFSTYEKAKMDQLLTLQRVTKKDREKEKPICMVLQKGDKLTIILELHC